MNFDERPRVEWQNDRTFEDGDFIVQVTKLPLRWPRFNFTVSMKGQDGKVMRFIPLRTSGQGKVEVRSVADQIAALIRQAEDYVREQVQQLEDQNIEQRQTREARGMQRDQPRESYGLKKGSREGWKGRRRDRERERSDY